MQFVSTRGKTKPLGFCDTVLAGLADDGGLFLPEVWPRFSADEIIGFANRPFAEIAFEVISRFVDGEIPDKELRRILHEAYAGFSHPSTAPVVELEPGHFVLELFHGPTLAFKDVAMQFLGRTMDHILIDKGLKATIVGATSGDTGSAAIEAFRGRENIDIFILHPKGRTSDVQRRQMTTVFDDNVHNIALEGTFDDCQHIVKAMFNNSKFRTKARLSGVNSINWGRIVAQIVYYFTSAVALGAPYRDIAFTVPTGNFGDIFAGYCAKRMGLPISKLIIATNENDILRRAFDTGHYDTDVVKPTSSPSMDIQISSNFERLLFEMLEGDAAEVNRLMASLVQSGGFAIPPSSLEKLHGDFTAGTTNERETAAVMQSVYAQSGYLVDPHTAVAIHVARSNMSPKIPMISLATAHPAKFPDAVFRATGISPELPKRVGDLDKKEERVTVLSNDQAVVEGVVSARSRAWEE